MTETRRRRARRAVVAAAACAAALPTAPALAAPDQLSLIEDEKLMLESGAAAQAQALDEAKALGADVIRANVIWSRYAPAPTSSRRPRGFDGKDPAAYPNLAIVDSLVAGAQARGMQVLLTPTGPIPAWASRCRGSLAIKRVCKPNPQLFGAVRARARQALPDREAVVDLERAEPALVAAAAVRGVGLVGRPEVRVAVPRARRLGDRRPARHRPPRRPDLARRDRAARRRSLRLLRPAQPARARALRGRILKTSPEVFLRGVFCLNPRGGRLAGTEGRDQRCSNYKRLSVTGYAHHPYTRGGSRPPLSRTNKGEITIGVATRLTRLLDQAARAKRIPAGLPIHYTEHGWQTNPPDRIFGVTDDQQAEYINQSDWIAYNNARVHTVAQYKIVDDENIGVGLPDGRAAVLRRGPQARL